MSNNPKQQNNNEETPLPRKKITVLFPDPTLTESYYEYWIPQDDLDLEEFMDNIKAIKGVEQVEFFDDHRAMMKKWMANPPEFVFNQCDDGYMNREEFEVHLVAFLDMIGVPYTGPGVEGLGITKDKSIVRGLAQSIGVPVPVEVYIDLHEDIASKIPEDMVYPAFCKLATASGSTGIVNYGLAHNKEEAIKSLTKMRQDYPNRPVLLQEFLSGREISVGMVGNPELGDFEIFHPVEVDYGALNKDKYVPVQLEEFKRDGDSEFWQQVKEVKAKLTAEQLQEIQTNAEKLFIRCRCKDFARMDMRMDSKGQFKIMDVNPNCWLGGKYRLMAEWAGYSWPQILGKIFLTAQNRFEKNKEKIYKPSSEEENQKMKEKVEKLKEEHLKKKQELLLQKTNSNNNNNNNNNNTNGVEKNHHHHFDHGV